MATQSVDDFDYIMLTIHDVHGLSRGRMVAKNRMAAIIKNGLGTNSGLCFCSIRGGEIDQHEDFDEGNGCGFKVLKPLLDTLVYCPILGQDKFKVGQVFCCLEFEDGRLDTSTPHTAAEIQIERLRSELGLIVKSAFEIEFFIREAESKRPFGHLSTYSSTDVLENCQAILFDMIQALRDRGIIVDSAQTENGFGEFEFTLDVAEGLEAICNTVQFKNIIKRFMKSRGYEATFMSAMTTRKEDCSTLHFNHSLWTPSGENAFLDTSKPNNLSELGCHWLAGLIEHAPAMTAFCLPTINCYRSASMFHMPHQADWSVGDRSAAFRLKIEGQDNIYIENRLPSSACNPYLVLICTLAAGIDGVKRKLPLPATFESKCVLPKDLETALKTLEADTVLKEAMGSKLVDYFCFVKRKFELEEFAAAGNLSDEELLKMENEYYFHNV